MKYIYCASIKINVNAHLYNSLVGFRETKDMDLTELTIDYLQQLLHEFIAPEMDKAKEDFPDSSIDIEVLLFNRLN